MAKSQEPGGWLPGRPGGAGAPRKSQECASGEPGPGEREGERNLECRWGGVRLRGKGVTLKPSLTSPRRRPLWSQTRMNPGGKTAAAAGAHSGQGSPGAEVASTSALGT